MLSRVGRPAASLPRRLCLPLRLPGSRLRCPLVLGVKVAPREPGVAVGGQGGVPGVLMDRLEEFELLVTALVLKIDMTLASGGSTWFTPADRPDHLAASSGGTPRVQTLVTACLRLL
ncbi:MAG: hypothetical protein WDW36_002153 [Sanguina aurantia]